jgi:hypothetical protein
MVEVCRPLGVEVFRITDERVLEGWKSPECPRYKGVHGVKMKEMKERKDMEDM